MHKNSAKVRYLINKQYVGRTRGLNITITVPHHLTWSHGSSIHLPSNVILPKVSPSLFLWISYFSHPSHMLSRSKSTRVPYPLHLLTYVVLGSEYFHGQFVSKTLCSSLKVRDSVLHPYKSNGKFVVFYAPNFSFLESFQAKY